MRFFLIDAENVNFDNFIKQRTFKKKDRFYIIGNSTLKFSLFTLRFLQDKKVKFYDFNECSKDYADKIILTMLGFLLAQKKFKKCFIVSNDKIFSRLEFTKDLYKKRVKVLSPSNEKIKKIQKSAYHIQLFEKNQQFIKDLREESINLGEFHRLLQKHFKIHGTLIYKYLKQEKNEEFFAVKKTEFLLEKTADTQELQKLSNTQEQMLMPQMKLLSYEDKDLQKAEESFDKSEEQGKAQEPNAQKKHARTQNRYKKSFKNTQNSNEKPASKPQENTAKESFFKLINPFKFFK